MTPLSIQSSSSLVSILSHFMTYMGIYTLMNLAFEQNQHVVDISPLLLPIKQWPGNAIDR